ncbi:hypothetical protein EIP91_005475 [Steccherinum ochraceum]|uniref:F-box domain-containing protein n=1 Tax=Steccherinum ochraceum TaxID=92696 RepID=A0A4R0RZ62_9APHY|nr:hypothetical protein EIP91_005475 [Steccherinum ochraceum]
MIADQLISSSRNAFSRCRTRCRSKLIEGGVEEIWEDVCLGRIDDMYADIVWKTKFLVKLDERSREHIISVIAALALSTRPYPLSNSQLLNQNKYAFMTITDGALFRQAQDGDDTGFAELKTRRRHNLLNSTTVLPPELLVEIFRYYKVAELERDAYTHSWLRITHVCHHWRQLALQTPTLWSDIVITGQGANGQRQPACTLEILSRSDQVPLDLEVWDPTDPMLPAVQALMRSVPRARTLEARLTHSICQGLTEIRLIEALHLTSIFLACEFATIVQLFDTCSMPLLREVEVETPRMNWNLPFLRCPLTSLAFDSTVMEPLPSILPVLAQLPALQHLRINATFPERDGSAVFPHVSLPALKTLTLITSMEAFTFLYKHIDIPPKAIMRFDVSFLHLDEPEEFALIFPSFAANFEDLAARFDVHIRGLKFSTRPPNSVQLELYVPDAPVMDYFLNPNTRPHLRITLHRQYEFAQTVLLGLLRVLPLTKATHLGITGTLPADEQEPVPIDGFALLIEDKFPSLTYLHLSGKQVTQHAPYLLSRRVSVAPSLEHPETSAEQWLMPRLQYLSLTKAVFRQPGTPLHEPSAFRNDLMDVLVARADASGHAPSINLHDSVGFSAGDAGEMCMIMDRVYWGVHWSGGDAEEET